MKNTLKLLVLSLLIVQFSSCTKDETTPAASKTDIITAKPWEINQADFSAGLSLTVYKKGAAGNLLDASKISLTFKKDGTITATDLDGNALAGKWSFNADETKITLPPGLPFETVSIETLTATNLNVTVPQFTYTVIGQTVTGILAVKMIPKG